MLNGGGTWQPNGATLGLDPWSQTESRVGVPSETKLRTWDSVNYIHS